MAIVAVHNLIKKFGHFTALDGVNLELTKGEIYGFIGPNGAGKTTTIRVLLGILKATEGNATVFDLDAWNDAVEIHKRIAYVPGDVNLWDGLTGGEVIDLFIKLRGNNDNHRRDDLIKRFDLDPTKKCRTYSKGNRQKVALIAALASDAELYILDEPTSGLDPLMERVFKDCVLELKKQGKTVFLSSHILSEVEELCDKVSIIRNGKIIETGTLKELRHLTQTTIKVETSKEIDGLDKVTGVHNIIRLDNEVAFQVDHDDIGTAIKYISQFEVTNMVCTPPSLEELFMTHYEGERGGD